jgi:hypothetical protein
MLFSDRRCTATVGASSTASVSQGRAGASAAVTPPPGRYFWRASYSGDTANAPSSSTCGGEILEVTRAANFGLPSSRLCQSGRRFIAHPRAPRHVSLRRVTVMINGKIRFSGNLVGTHTTIDLRGMPRGTFHVAMIARSSNGRSYEDLRTYHTCIPGRHGQKRKG